MLINFFILSILPILSFVFLFYLLALSNKYIYSPYPIKLTELKEIYNKEGVIICEF